VSRFWLMVDVAGTAIALTILGISVWLDPDPRGHGTHTQLGLAPCGYLALTGKPCISCGMTTAFANMVRGRVAAAYDANPMGIVLFVLTAAAPVWLIGSALTRQDPFRFQAHPVGRWFLPTIGALLLGTWLFRVLTT
jgi:hypothetical protein